MKPLVGSLALAVALTSLGNGTTAELTEVVNVTCAARGLWTASAVHTEAAPC
jgi:hypothetical protein